MKRALKKQTVSHLFFTGEKPFVFSSLFPTLAESLVKDNPLAEVSGSKLT